MKNLLLATALAATVISVPALAFADPPAPNVYQSLESSKAHAAGVIRGEIDSVDYSGGAVVVRTSRGAQRIAVVPNTTIYNGSDYAALSDLRRGQTVEIAVYEIDGRLVAQSIRLK